MFLLKKENLNKVLNIWAKEAELFSPQIEDDQVMLLPHEENKFAMDYINFPFPAKEYLFKQREVLFKWQNDNGNFSIETPENKNTNDKIYFGIRPCEVYGIMYTDKFFLEGDYRDNFYANNRENTAIVSVNCTEVGENCFCGSTGTGPFAKAGYDLLFTPIKDKYLVEVATEKGDKLLSYCREFLVEVSEELLEEKENIEKTTLDKFVTKINATNVSKVLEDNFDNPIWQELGTECVTCTGCTSVCPTCTCFNVVEQSTGDNSGRRIRFWDSCQSDSFTRNAGDHNPRNNVSRVRYRIYDKFKYIEDKFEMKGCTGCGRCINVCPASINSVNIINSLSKNNGGE